MTEKPPRLGRVAAAVGGFLILVGIVMIGILVLAIFSVVDDNVLTSPEYQKLFVWVLIAIGALDLVGGIMLLR